MTMGPMTTTNRCSPADGRPARDGFTLVEILVAITVLTVGLLALVATSAVLMRGMTGAAAQSRAAVVAFSRIEQMRSVPCSSMAAGTASANGVSERWTVADSGRAKFIVDTVSFNVGPTVKQRSYRSMIAC
ncbi:MAG: hypothetical protein NVS9B3_09240 [Gemmatimonadaceae bacterium]